MIDSTRISARDVQSPAMASLILGPLLRYVGRTEATVWIEADHAYEVLAEDSIEVPFRGSTVQVCSLAHLRLMKQTAGRPQDLVDLENLPSG